MANKWSQGHRQTAQHNMEFAPGKLSLDQPSINLTPHLLRWLVILADVLWELGDVHEGTQDVGLLQALSQLWMRHQLADLIHWVDAHLALNAGFEAVGGVGRGISLLIDHPEKQTAIAKVLVRTKSLTTLNGPWNAKNRVLARDTVQLP